MVMNLTELKKQILKKIYLFQGCLVFEELYTKRNNFVGKPNFGFHVI